MKKIIGWAILGILAVTFVCIFSIVAGFWETLLAMGISIAFICLVGLSLNLIDEDYSEDVNT